MLGMEYQIGCYIFIIVIGFIQCSGDLSPVTFTFKEYQYKDSPKNEMTFREFETACEQSSACSHMAGLQRTRCVRECVSPSCYRELYQADPVYVIQTTNGKSFIDETIHMKKLQK